MEALQLTKLHKPLYTASANKIAIIETPPLNALIIAGAGSPDQEAFQNAVGALYGLSYTLKFAFKMRKENPLDHKVMPLECLWWTDGAGSFDLNNRADWKWEALIVQPDYFTADDVARAAEKAGSKRPNPAIGDVRLETINEGMAAQILHVGPYSTEPETIAKLHAAILEHNGRIAGKHHEIYLGDPRRTAPEKLRTILRQPFTV